MRYRHRSDAMSLGVVNVRRFFFSFDTKKKGRCLLEYFGRSCARLVSSSPPNGKDWLWSFIRLHVSLWCTCPPRTYIDRRVRVYACEILFNRSRVVPTLSHENGMMSRQWHGNLKKYLTLIIVFVVLGRIQRCFWWVQMYALSVDYACCVDTFWPWRSNITDKYL